MESQGNSFLFYILIESAQPSDRWVRVEKAFILQYCVFLNMSLKNPN